MKINQTVTTVFPAAASDLGIDQGVVQVTVAVDREGNLADYVLTDYTHQVFADATVKALKRWTYEPAYIHGRANGATVDLTFSFERQGIVVVDMTVLKFVEQMNYRLHPQAYEFHACTLQQLDRIPTPTKVVRPIYPIETAKKQQGTIVVTVTFYIDDQGTVRLPAVSRETGEANPLLAAAAVDAVSQWHFEPPMSKGRPVLVAARQDFNFKPTL